MLTLLVSLIVAVSIIFFPHTVFAQDLDWTKISTTYSPLTQIKTGNYVSGFLQIALGAIVTACLIFLLIGGYRWITSKGEKEALAKSQKTISGALIGLVIAMAIFIILGLLSAFTHIDLFRFCIPGVGPAGQCNIPYTGAPGGGITNGTPSTGVGNSRCGGCIDGGCGISGTTYIGAPFDSRPSPCFICDPYPGGWRDLGTDCSGLGGVACGNTCAP